MRQPHVIQQANTLQGTTWLLDQTARRGCIDQGLQTLGCWEPRSTMHTEREVRPGWHCLDIGAHFGYYSVLLSRLVGPTGRVVAVEPEAEFYLALGQHLGLNGCANVQPLHRALGDADDEVPLLRSLLGGKLDFVKLDVDGPEIRILRRLEPLIRELRPSLILFEVVDYCLRRMEGEAALGQRAEELCQMVSDYGYQLRCEDQWQLVTPAEVLPLRDWRTSGLNLFAQRRP